jgi:5'-nucleotidase
VGRTSVELDARLAANRTRETNIGDFIADAFRNVTGADVALINGGSIRADSLISPGQLTTREILQILPFKNRVVKVQVNGDTLRQALEHGVARSAEDAEPGRFPQISGIRFTFDASRKPGSRITAVTVNGKPLLEKKLYTLATTTFVALDGGDDYKMFKGAPLLLAPEQGQIDSEILRKAITSVRSIAPQTDGRIKRLDQNRSQIVDCE